MNSRLSVDNATWHGNRRCAWIGFFLHLSVECPFVSFLLFVDPILGKFVSFLYLFLPPKTDGAL